MDDAGSGRGAAAAALGAGVALGLALMAAPRHESLGRPLDEDARIPHLLRRAGFGASAAEVADYRALGVEGTVERLVEYEHVPETADEKLELFYFDPAKLSDIQRKWVARMFFTTRPLREKVVLFWHGLLTSANSKVGRPELMDRQNDLFRRLALAPYGELLKAVSQDPAMMIWLDTRNSRRSAPNENYARELLELFSMGVGPYTEQDVRQAAQAFTGWTLDRDYKAVFNPSQADRESKPFLGTMVKTPEDVVDAIVAHPATADFMAEKLFAFFAYPNPEPATVAPYAELFRATSGSIKAVVRAILTSPPFYSERAYRARLKSPVEYAVGVLRQLRIPTDGGGVVERMVRMGQQLYNPPNVAGWPGGRTWLNSGTWIERMNFANAVTATRGESRIIQIDVRRYLEELGLRRADEVVEHFLGLLVDGRTNARARRVLDDYLGVAPSHDVLADRKLVDEKLRGLVYLVLAMPEYQLC
jgi:uncharacterized protein (DUF1800 family)